MYSGERRAGGFAAQEKRRAVSRNAAAVLLVCVIFSFFLSWMFIMLHAEHEHDHSGLDGACAVCEQIVEAERVFRQFSFVAAAIAAVCLFRRAWVILCCRVADAVSLFATPVQLKVRMNN